MAIRPGTALLLCFHPVVTSLPRLLSVKVQFTEYYSQTQQIIAKKSGFYIIMLHVSASTAITRLSLYKNVQRKVNMTVPVAARS